MYSATRNEAPADFVRRRIVRVAPLYWLATAAFIATQPKLLWSGPDALLNIGKSLLFIPFANPQHGGQPWPVLIPGWTLNYEMFFYLLFAVGIALARPALFTLAAIGSLVIVGLLLHPAGAVTSTYTAFILTEFAAGIVLAMLYERYRFGRMAWLIPLGFVALLMSGQVPIHHGVVALAGSAAILAGALSLERSWARQRAMPLFKLLGDASYAIYLTHGIALPYIRRLYGKLPLEGWPQLISYLLFAMVACSVFGIVVHLVVERPLLARLGRWTRPKPRASQQPPRDVY